MGKWVESRVGKTLSIRTILYFIIFCSCFGFCSVNPFLNVPDESGEPEPAALQSEAPDSLADFSSYHILVYDPHNSSSSDTQAAMSVLGITNYTLRTSANPVTLADLNTHDILIVGWNSGGNHSGLSAGVLAAGITGRVFLTGHDLDYHIVHGPLAARTLFLQALQFVLDGKGTGMIGLTDPTSLFSWIPAAWGVQASQDGGEYVTTITEDALVWDIYDGLVPNSENPDIRLSRWGTSYHTQFSLHNSRFVPFELGGSNGQEIVTVANFNIPGLDFEKTVNSDPNTLPCVDVWGEAEFTISYTYSDDPNHTRQPLTEARLVDYIPPDAEYVTSSPLGDYDFLGRTVTWELGTLYPGTSGNVTIRLRVNENSEPGGVVVNTAELIAEDIVLARTHRSISVCCWGGDVIYVDDTATGYNNGTSWANAYTDLQAAIARAEKGCGTQIWIAKGIYNPGHDVTASFTIPAGVSVYGGFAGTETELNQRNIETNPTILSGYIRTVNGIEERNRTVVTMGEGCLLDGVIVKNGERYGIYGENVDFEVRHCDINNHSWYGLWCRNGNLELTHTVICDNSYDGLYLEGHNKMARLENCVISNNSRNGINCWYSTPTIINSVIHHNGADSDASSLYYGVRLFQPNSRPVLRNNTIVCNSSAGIYYVNNSSGTLPKPQVKNSIVWHNAEAEGFADIQGLNDIVRSCLTDPNDVYGIHPQADANGNLRSNPVFAYSDLSLCNFHLAYHSPCRDAGDPNETAATEADMDNQARIAGNSVEMGANEVDCEDVFNPLDWDADGLVNLKEFKAFSAAWLTIDPNHPNLPNPVEPNAILHWNPICDLDDDMDVDMGDLMLFIPEWCWLACWRYDISAIQQQAVTINALSIDGITENRLLSEDSIGTVDRKIPSPQKSIRQEVLELQDAIQFLEQLWLDDPALQETNTTESWNSFIQSLQEGLVELKTKTNTIILSEEVQ